MNFQMFKLCFKKAEEPEISLPTSDGSLKKQEISIKASTSALLTMLKPLTVWITANCGKILKEMGIPDRLTCLSGGLDFLSSSFDDSIMLIKTEKPELN